MLRAADPRSKVRARWCRRAGAAPAAAAAGTASDLLRGAGSVGAAGRQDVQAGPPWLAEGIVDN